MPCLLPCAVDTPLLSYIPPQLYNMWLSLAGSLVCAAIMFVVSWFNALLTLAALLALYLLVSYRKPGDTRSTIPPTFSRPIH